MAGNNGLGVDVRKFEVAGRPWVGLAREAEAAEEEIKALVSNSRLRLFKAVDVELRRVLREAMPGLSEPSWPELLPEEWEAKQGPPIEATQHEARTDKPQGVSDQAPAPHVDVNTHPERDAVASLNGHDSSPGMATATVAAGSQESARGNVDTQDGMEDPGQPSQEVAAEGPPPDGSEAYSGTVQLVVAVEQSAIQALQFVDELCRHPLMRLQRLLGTAKGRLDIWVLLREPMHLKEALLGMAGVSQVNTIPPHGHQDTGVYVEVRLKEPAAVHGS